MVAPDSKRTKRIRDESEHLSLEEHIAQRRGVLVREREEAPTLRRRAREMRAKAGALAHRWQARMRAEYHRRADELEFEASVRESMHREHTFESTVVAYLRVYHKESGVPSSSVQATRKSDSIEAYVRQTDIVAQRRTVILDEYLAETTRAPPKVVMAAHDVSALRLVARPAAASMQHALHLSCPACGYSVTYLDATTSSTAFDEVIEFSQYSYKRVNHYSMWLTLVQGKEAHRVPDDVLTQVMTHLYDQQGIRVPTDITPRRVRDVLRKLRLRRAYDHVTQITARLSGVRPPRLTPATEEKLRNLFLQMQPAFQRHAPKTRTNFLSYSYVLYRSFQMLGLHHMLDNITLLKGRDKLEANDAIFWRMADDLGWKVSDLPPVTAAGA